MLYPTYGAGGLCSILLHYRVTQDHKAECSYPLPEVMWRTRKRKMKAVAMGWQRQGPLFYAVANTIKLNGLTPWWENHCDFKCVHWLNVTSPYSFSFLFSFCSPLENDDGSLSVHHKNKLPVVFVCSTNQSPYRILVNAFLELCVYLGNQSSVKSGIAAFSFSMAKYSWHFYKLSE